MKRETLRHPKLHDLCAELDCSRPEALGYLTLLWDFTADQATEGDIGKWKNGAIARACDWQGAPDEFIRALVSAGWLDRDPCYRLIVHDWSDHAERWVSLKLGKLGRDFIKSAAKRSIEPPAIASIEASTDTPVEPSPPRDQTKPTQTKPSRGADAPAAFQRFWERYPIKKAKGQALKAWKKLAPDDALTATMLAAIDAQQHERDAKARRREFVPEWKHPGTWLNGRCWEDEAAPPSSVEPCAPMIGEPLW